VEGCGYAWDFQSRKPSEKLKRGYWVRCPSCKQKVFYRAKRKRLEARNSPEESVKDEV